MGSTDGGREETKERGPGGGRESERRSCPILLPKARAYWRGTTGISSGLSESTAGSLAAIAG